MGCMISTSNRKHFGYNNKYVKYDESSLNKLPSTSHLILLLQQPYLRASFKSFVIDKWIPAETKDDPNFHLQARTIALNCIEFWLDCKDFSLLKSSSFFKTYRACYIFEKYLMHGIPLIMN